MVIGPHLIILDFLVVKIQTILFIFALFFVANDFQIFDLLQFINNFIPLLCGKYHVKVQFDQFFCSYVLQFLALN